MTSAVSPGEPHPAEATAARSGPFPDATKPAEAERWIRDNLRDGWPVSREAARTVLAELDRLRGLRDAVLALAGRLTAEASNPLHPYARREVQGATAALLRRALGVFRVSTPDLTEAERATLVEQNFAAEACRAEGGSRNLGYAAVWDLLAAAGQPVEVNALVWRAVEAYRDGYELAAARSTPEAPPEEPEDGPAFFAAAMAQHGRCWCSVDADGGFCGECPLCAALPPAWPCPTIAHNGYPLPASASPGAPTPPGLVQQAIASARLDGVPSEAFDDLTRKLLACVASGSLTGDDATTIQVALAARSPASSPLVEERPATHGPYRPWVQPPRARCGESSCSGHASSPGEPPTGGAA